MLELTAEDFEALLNQDSVSRVLLATMAAQLQHSRARIMTGGALATTLAVVPAQAHDGGIFAEVADTFRARSRSRPEPLLDDGEEMLAAFVARPRGWT